MATTRRETTASYRSEAKPITVEGPQLVPLLDLAPITSTSPQFNCQEAFPSRQLIREPVIFRLADAATIAYGSHTRTCGSTVSVFEGNLVGRSLFAVSLFSTRTVEFDAPPTWRQLFVFVLLNSDLLLSPGYALGTWFDEHRGIHVLDVVVSVSGLQVALELARQFNQSAIFDLARLQEIPVHRQFPAAVSGFVGGGQ